jgi:hypothetical protein
MSDATLIDDDPEWLPERVRHLFPAPAHRVEIAYTGSAGLQCLDRRPLASKGGHPAGCRPRRQRGTVCGNPGVVGC